MIDSTSTWIIPQNVPQKDRLYLPGAHVFPIFRAFSWIYCFQLHSITPAFKVLLTLFQQSKSQTDGLMSYFTPISPPELNKD